jgi:hypothetical protein
VIENPWMVSSSFVSTGGLSLDGASRAARLECRPASSSRGRANREGRSRDSFHTPPNLNCCPGACSSARSLGTPTTPGPRPCSICRRRGGWARRRRHRRPGRRAGRVDCAALGRALLPVPAPMVVFPGLHGPVGVRDGAFLLRRRANRTRALRAARRRRDRRHYRVCLHAAHPQGRSSARRAATRQRSGMRGLNAWATLDCVGPVAQLVRAADS